MMTLRHSNVTMNVYVKSVDAGPMKAMKALEDSGRYCAPTDSWSQGGTRITMNMAELLGGGAWTRTTDLRIMRPSL